MTYICMKCGKPTETYEGFWYDSKVHVFSKCCHHSVQPNSRTLQRRISAQKEVKVRMKFKPFHLEQSPSRTWCGRLKGAVAHLTTDSRVVTAGPYGCASCKRSFEYWEQGRISAQKEAK